VYAGLAASFLELFSPLNRRRFSALSSRWYGCGVGVWNCALPDRRDLPVGETQIQAQQDGMDEYVPAYQFEEFHSILVHAPRERVFQSDSRSQRG